MHGLPRFFARPVLSRIISSSSGIRMFLINTFPSSSVYVFTRSVIRRASRCLCLDALLMRQRMSGESVTFAGIRSKTARGISSDEKPHFVFPRDGTAVLTINLGVRRLMASTVVVICEETKATHRPSALYALAVCQETNRLAPLF